MALPPEGCRMTLAQLIVIALQTSIALIVLSIALDARLDDITSLLRRPGLLARSLLAMNVVMPAFAVAVAWAFDLNPAVEVALVATALAPVPPVLPHKQMKAGGSHPYMIGLLAITALVSIAYVPAAVEVLGRIFGRPFHAPAAGVAKIVATSVLAPLALGMLVKRFAPAMAERIVRPLSIAGMVLLAIALAPVLIKEWPGITALIGNYSVVAMVVFALVALAVGHALGGRNADDRTVLATATSARHPAVALAMTHHAQDRSAVLAAVLLTLIVAAVVSIPYVMWRARSHAGAHPSPHVS